MNGVQRGLGEGKVERDNVTAQHYTSLEFLGMGDQLKPLILFFTMTVEEKNEMRNGY